MEAKWSPNRDEIYYRNLDMRKMMVVPIKFNPVFEAEVPKVLFQGEFLDIGGFSYDITPDGKHFLMKESVVKEHTTTQISIIANWFEEIKQKQAEQ